MNLADYNLGDSSFRMQQYPQKWQLWDWLCTWRTLSYFIPILRNISNFWQQKLAYILKGCGPEIRYKISTWPARLIWCPPMTCKSYIQWLYFVRNVIPKRNTQPFYLDFEIVVIMTCINTGGLMHKHILKKQVHTPHGALLVQ